MPVLEKVVPAICVVLEMKEAVGETEGHPELPLGARVILRPIREVIDDQPENLTREHRVEEFKCDNIDFIRFPGGLFMRLDEYEWLRKRPGIVRLKDNLACEAKIVFLKGQPGEYSCWLPTGILDIIAPGQRR